MAKNNVCSIPNCCNPVLNSRGWCSKHYQRWQRTGDPLKSRTNREQTGKPCSVQGCNNKSGFKGFCQHHYGVWRRTGDPLTIHDKFPHATWLNEHKSYSSDECLIWPFSRSKESGRGVALGTSAPNAMCRLAHGDPPTSEHQTAHSCGNGHNGCVNPKHLRWATRKENEADKILHGTIRRGSKVNTSKLTSKDVLKIRKIGRTVSRRALAEKYGVSSCTIFKILNRKTWAWLDD